MKHQNKQVQVTLEFPERTDQKAEQEFISRLKAIYLEKRKAEAVQKEDSASSFPAVKDKGEDNA